MALYRQVSKYIYPVLRKNGFQKENFYWCRRDSQFSHLALVRTSRHGEAQEVLEIWLGAFSVAIEELYCQRLPLGVPIEEMPSGLMFCHFDTNFWCLDEDLSWNSKRAKHCFFPRDTDVTQELLEIAERLEVILPNFAAFFGSVENITNYKMQGFGTGSIATGGKLQAAAGCIVLGRYQEAEVLIMTAIKAGSSPLHREIALRLSVILEERRSNNA